MRPMRLFLLVAVAGCASANVGGTGDDEPVADAPPASDIDAPPPIDAALSSTLQQTTDNTIVAANSVACGANGTTAENSWYRVFALTEHAITTQFFVNQVTFGVQESGGSPPVQVKIGTYTGAIGGANIDLAQISPLNSAVVNVPPTTTGISVPVPITATIPANAQLIVEILAPDLGATTADHFYIGASTSAETRPGYIRAPDCSIATPQTVAATGFPASHIVITVTGTH